MSEMDYASEILNEIFWMRREIREIKKTLEKIENHLYDMTYRYGRLCGAALREFKQREREVKSDETD